MGWIDELKSALNIVKKVRLPSKREVNRIARISFFLMLFSGIFGLLVSILFGLI